MSAIAQFVPQMAIITAITTAQNAEVTTAIPHGFAVGAFIRLNIPSEYGMAQANGTQVLITEIPTDTTFTTNLTTTSFEDFSIPENPKQSALAIPIGEFAPFLASTKTNILGGQPNGLIPPMA